MRFLYCVVLLLGVGANEAIGAAPLKGDTLRVQASDLAIKDLQTGDYSFMIVRRKAMYSPAMGMILA